MKEHKSRFTSIVGPSLLSVVGVVLMMAVGYFVIKFLVGLFAEHVAGIGGEVAHLPCKRPLLVRGVGVGLL